MKLDYFTTTFCFKCSKHNGECRKVMYDLLKTNGLVKARLVMCSCGRTVLVILHKLGDEDVEKLLYMIKANGIKVTDIEAAQGVKVPESLKRTVT